MLNINKYINSRKKYIAFEIRGTKLLIYKKIQGIKSNLLKV